MRKLMIVAVMTLAPAQLSIAQDIGGTGDYRQYCTACTPSMWGEVLPSLPRREDGVLMRPIDNVTVLRAYRNMWIDEQGAKNTCLNMWANERVTYMVQKARALRACGKKCKGMK